MSLDLAAFDHHDIRRSLEGFGHIMRDVECGDISLCEPCRQLLQDGSLQIRVEAIEWFVQQQQARLGSEGAGQRYALLLASGKIGRTPLGEMAGLKELKHLLHALSARAAAKPGKPKGNIGGYIHVGKQGGLLGNKPDAAFCRGNPNSASPSPAAFFRRIPPGHVPA